jgi:hypothetical protein
VADGVNRAVALGGGVCGATAVGVNTSTGVPCGDLVAGVLTTAGTLDGAATAAETGVERPTSSKTDAAPMTTTTRQTNLPAGTRTGPFDVLTEPVSPCQALPAAQVVKPCCANLRISKGQAGGDQKCERQQEGFHRDAAQSTASPFRPRSQVLDRLKHCRFVINGQDRRGGWCRFLEGHSQEYGWHPEPPDRSTGR